MSLRDLAESLKLEPSGDWDGDNYNAGIDALVEAIESSDEIEVVVRCRPQLADDCPGSAHDYAPPRSWSLDDDDDYSSVGEALAPQAQRELANLAHRTDELMAMTGVGSVIQARLCESHPVFFRHPADVARLHEYFEEEDQL